MKIRNGFVSNSSSSSFIVIDSKSDFQIEEYKTPPIVVNANFCKMEFGWDFKKYTDWREKLAFAYLQTTYAKKQVGKQWLKMVKKVVKDHLKVNVEFDIDNKIYDCYAYIDHQSNASEDSNIQIFENETVLRDFIFRKDSYIQGGNDNEDCYDF